MSPQALVLFRLIERLSRRTGYACVTYLAKLAEMLRKQGIRAALSTTRAHLSELIAAGWIERKQTRKGGTSKLFFTPLVQVATRARGLFSARPAGGYSGGYSPSNLAVTPSAPIRKTPVGKETTTQRATNTKPSAVPTVEPCPVAVSLLKRVVSESEAKELAREAEAQKLSPEQIQRVLAAYQSQAQNIRNRGAWLREALRRGFSPPAPAHASDQVGVPTARTVLVSAAALDREPRPTPAFSASRIAHPGALQGEQGKLGGLGAWEALRGKMGVAHVPASRHQAC